MAFIGLILLIRIVRNAIMMINFALIAQHKQGKSPADAIRQACLLRFTDSDQPRCGAAQRVPVAFSTGSEPIHLDRSDCNCSRLGLSAQIS